ncbi:hypothetical protein [Pararhizobium sp. A13]|uniref:hypothetical protein n=1 Tax=Pararhizobium sp. A13 TaxID=3133975 RepID=UPI0032534467
MRINLSPQMRDDSLSVSVAGDVLTVNGEAFDFTPLPEGATLPFGAVDSEWFAGPVSREDGLLTVTLLLPHKPNASSNVTFPEPIMTTGDGPVSLPVNLNAIEEEILANDDN